MRGKGKSPCIAFAVRRITPAYAGKSLRYSSVIFLVQDHPRLCGEKTDAIKTDDIGVGSPPPMRGKVSQQSVRKPHSGITPAYAGKSPIVHTSSGIFEGSPPPMRGKVVHGSTSRTTNRITPAYAGKSSTILFFTNCL